MERLQKWGSGKATEQNKSTLDGTAAANGNGVGVIGGIPVVAGKRLKAHAIGSFK
jgi:hypothetical protein